MSKREQLMSSVRSPGPSGRIIANYLPKHVVMEGLQKKEMFQGILHVATSNERSYITVTDFYRDVLIETIEDRNGALDGDHVIVHLKPISQWKVFGSRSHQLGAQLSNEMYLQRTAKVVYVLERENPRKYIGVLQDQIDTTTADLLFIPQNAKIPSLHIQQKNIPESCPLLKDSLYVARFVSWDESTKQPFGELLEYLGPCSNTDVEIKAVLIELDIDINELPEVDVSGMKITHQELTFRHDFRHKCVLTIDPSGASDLDDALSCESLSNGNHRISVHIADVSFYLKEDSPLEKLVAKRATSVFLPNQVYQLLPPEMSSICSLSPGEDKLTVSVMWEITETGDVVSEEIVPSVINSCAKLSYEDVQDVLNSSSEETEKILPLVGRFSDREVREVIRRLNSIANALREKREGNGALSLHQTKFQMVLDHETGIPIGFRTETPNDSHRLVEEFMILSNVTVASVIANQCGNLAIFRYQPPPRPFLMDRLKARLKGMDLSIDMTSSSTILRCLMEYRKKDLNIWTALNYLFQIPMSRAVYNSPGVDPWEGKEHYALNAPAYTHFTSPIRQYADILVHRLLKFAVFGLQPRLEWEPSYLKNRIDNCNEKSWAAKSASRRVNLILLREFLLLKGSQRMSGVVVEVKDNYFDIITFDIGNKFRVFVKDICGEVKFKGNPPTLVVVWKHGEELHHQETIRALKSVTVNLMHDVKNQIKAVLVEPTCP